MQTKVIERYFFLGLLLATLIFTFFIFRPFWIILILGVSFSIVLYPIHKWLHSKKVPSWLSALITIYLFIVLLCGPLLGVGALVFNQSKSVYYRVTDGTSAEVFINSIDKAINNVLPEGVIFSTKDKALSFISYIGDNIANIFSTTVSALFSFVLMILIMFYCLKDGAEFKKFVIRFSPLGEENDEKIIDRLTQSIKGVIEGSLLIALIQGVLLGFGFFIFGVPNAALWGVVASIVSLVPTFGTALVSIPAIIFLFATGNVTSAIGLLVWATLLVGTIDNFLSPLIVGKKVKLPSILVLFSVLGGIALLGPAGVLIGPLTVSLLFALVSIYKNEFN